MSELSDIKDRVDEIYNAIYVENGQPSILGRLRTIERWIASHNDSLTWAFRLLVALAFGVIIKKLYGV